MKKSIFDKIIFFINWLNFKLNENNLNSGNTCLIITIPNIAPDHSEISVPIAIPITPYPRKTPINRSRKTFTKFVKTVIVTT